MDPRELATALQTIFQHSPAFPGEEIAVDLIANPKAGGFTRPSYSRKRIAELVELVSKAESLPSRSSPVALRLHLTERCGHAGDIARSVISEARGDRKGVRRLVLTAGGDGTSLETAGALADLPAADKERFALLRLPLGTGNDGSEGRDLAVCLGRLLGKAVVLPRPAVRVLPAPSGGKLASYAFNIASLGLDAYVCDMTNRLKTRFPGDSYKLWVDLASVLYERAWPPALLKLRVFDASGAELVGYERECLLVAVGASGNRQYGSNKRILPDENNACVVFRMTLGQKLAFKDRIASGGHRGLESVVRLFSGVRFEFEYSRGILLQRDGEVTELSSQDFPLAMEITEPIYNVVEYGEG